MTSLLPLPSQPRRISLSNAAHFEADSIYAAVLKLRRAGDVVYRIGKTQHYVSGEILSDRQLIGLAEATA